MIRPDESIEVLVYRVATGEIKHLYSGLCPDATEGADARDPDCEACKILVEFQEKFLKPS